jgi:type I restriction enzyme M protein
MSSFAEPQTEWIINNNLVNKGWVIDINPNKNVFFRKPPTEEQRKQLKGKQPDYILCQTGTTRPIAIIEAKKGGTDLKNALKQGTEYAEMLECPIVFAMNGAYCETRFIPNGKELILNKNEVRELITEVECLEFIKNNTNEVYTIPEEILISREELIKSFKNLNDILRGEGLRAGIERFSEFSNILFLKLMSENGKKSWWNSIKQQSDEDIIGYINSYVINQIQGEYGGDVFTPLSIKNPKTIRSIINKLDPLVLSKIDYDLKGEAFEYFLEQTTSTENDLGEYFTPRHIVKSIVNLINPKFGETIYDPFCGTGGFLTESFKYVKDNTIIKDKEQEYTLKHSTIYGREITQNARIAKMNMVLQGDGHSGVEQIDTLANPLNAKYDVIITNMPFAQKTDYGNLYYNGLAKKNGDAICVLHCLQALKQGGRMALVVPEGFLFRKDIAKVREFLLSKCKLQSVISLPQGTFLPYTGVKTDILYFTNAHEPNNQKSYWYFDVKNIGYTLDNHRRKIKGKNDLNKLAESDFKRAETKEEAKENMLEIGFEIIDLEKVKKNDWNWIGIAYRKIENSKNHHMISLSDVLSKCETGKRPKGGAGGFSGAISIGAEQIGTDGKLNLDKIPFVPIEFYKSATKGFLKNEDILICKDGALTGKVCIVEINKIPQKEVMTNEHVFILSGKDEIINQKYLFHILKSESMQKQIRNLAYNKSAQPGLNKQHLKQIQIPLPPLAEQQKIVDEIAKQEQEKELLKQRINEIDNSIKNSIDKIWE